MPDLSTIIDYCISVNNKSGSIPPAPQGLKKLKESIEGVPFALLTKGMSGIFDNNLVGQIMQMAQQMGGLQNMGGKGTQQIMQQLQNGTAAIDQVIQTFGGVTAMTAGLGGFLSSDDQKSITSLIPTPPEGT